MIGNGIFDKTPAIQLCSSRQPPFHRVVVQINQIGPYGLITYLESTSKWTVEQLAMEIANTIVLSGKA